MNTQTSTPDWQSNPNPKTTWRLFGRTVPPIALQFFQYALAGGIAFVGDFGMFYLALQVGFHYLIATALGFCVGLLCNYLLCVLWIWRGTRATTTKDFAVFSIIGLAGLFIATACMWLLVDLIQLTPLLAKVATSAAVLVWNFTLRKLLVFYH